MLAFSLFLSSILVIVIDICIIFNCCGDSFFAFYFLCKPFVSSPGVMSNFRSWVVVLCLLSDAGQSQETGRAEGAKFFLD